MPELVNRVYLSPFPHGTEVALEDTANRIAGHYERHALSWDADRRAATWMVAHGFHVTGVDSSPTLLSLSQTRMSDQEWIVGDVLGAPDFALDRFEAELGGGGLCRIQFRRRQRISGIEEDRHPAKARKEFAQHLEPLAGGICQLTRMALGTGIGVFEIARNIGTSVQMIQQYYGKQATSTVFATRPGIKAPRLLMASPPVPISFRSPGCWPLSIQ